VSTLLLVCYWIMAAFVGWCEYQIAVQYLNASTFKHYVAAGAWAVITGALWKVTIAWEGAAVVGKKAGIAHVARNP
jgi:hypothetical protein